MAWRERPGRSRARGMLTQMSQAEHTVSAPGPSDMHAQPEHSASSRALRHACTTAMNEPASPLVMLDHDSNPWADVAEWLLLVHMSPAWDPEGRRERDNLSRPSGFHYRGRITWAESPKQ